MTRDQFSLLPPSADALSLGGAQTPHSASPVVNLMGLKSIFPDIIGTSTPMLQVLASAEKIARTDSSVLILGESGTGKELIAAALHRLSERADKRFIAINCSAIPEELLESELFGFEKGAFTGADKKRAGYFEVASGGTIFLDEIGEMPKRLQAKLLRVLQERKFTPLGSNEEKSADTRIIAATNVNLEQAVHQGEFRLDLYYRLNVLPITLPPLRERGSDILLLCEHFLEIFNRVHGVAEDCYFAEDVASLLVHYSWPGNVRQLQNLIERVVVLSAGGKITTQYLPKEVLEQSVVTAPTKFSQQDMHAPKNFSAPLNGFSAGDFLHNDHFAKIDYPENRFAFPQEGLSLDEYLVSIENSFILEALKKTGNNKNKAAQLLGLNRTTLVERIKKRKILPLKPPSQEL